MYNKNVVIITPAVIVLLGISGLHASDIKIVQLENYLSEKLAAQGIKSRSSLAQLSELSQALVDAATGIEKNMKSSNLVTKMEFNLKQYKAGTNYIAAILLNLEPYTSKDVQKLKDTVINTSTKQIMMIQSLMNAVENGTLVDETNMVNSLINNTALFKGTMFEMHFTGDARLSNIFENIVTNLHAAKKAYSSIPSAYANFFKTEQATLFKEQKEASTTQSGWSKFKQKVKSIFES